MASWVRQLGSFPEDWERTEQQDDQFRATARMLDAEKIRLCRHDDALALVEMTLADFRNNGLLFAFNRAELGTLLVEIRNRRQLLQLGRERAKLKGPRMDPTRLPLDALERLIQSHSDLSLVERLRAERKRRQSIHKKGEG